MVGGLLVLRHGGGEVGVGYELRQEGVLWIEVETSGEPAVDGLKAELAYEDVPMVEVEM